MAITYTESWAQSFSESTDSRSITLELHVVSDDAVLTAVNYKTATHATTGALFPLIGTPLANTLLIEPSYTLRSRSAPSFEGPRYATVQCVYERGPFGGNEENDDPLTNPVRYRFREVTNAEPTDADAEGNPLLNSAGDPFASPVNTYYNSYILEATRNEAVFNAPLAVSYHNKINLGGFQIAGISLNPGEVLCTGISPPSEYKLNDPYVPVTYKFEIRERLRLSDGTRLTSFIHRILDQGRRAYTAEGVKVAIYDRNGDVPNPTPVVSDVLLDEGWPSTPDGADPATTWWSIDPSFNPDIGKGWAKNSQIASPPLVAIDRRTDADKPPVTWLFYRKYEETDFSGLNL